MTIYIDKDYKCHVEFADGLVAVETDFFDSKCDAYIEGYRFVPNGETWTRSDGEVFYGEMIAPWKNFNELAAAQRKYERQLLVEYEATIAELDAALLDAQYESLIGGL